MRFLMLHGEKVLCGIIVVLCGVWISQSLRDFRRIDPYPAGSPNRHGQDDEPIRLSPSYPYQSPHLAPYADRIQENLDRPQQPVELACTSRLFYPRPARPVFDGIIVDPPPPAAFASLPALREPSVNAHQGGVTVSCIVPPQPKYFLPVRIEVQRGTLSDRIDRPVHAFELAPPPVGATKDLAQTPVAVPQRIRRGGAQERRQTAPKPVQLQFEDPDVKALETVHYRVRLVARLRADVPPLPAFVFEDGKEIPLQLAESLEQIQDSADGTALYAGPWSPVAHATVPADLQLRYQCITRGALPADAAVPQDGYTVFLGVRIWDREARAWSESSFEATVGQPIRGRLKFRVGTETKVREFDTGLVLEAVRPATKVRIARTTELVTEERPGGGGQIAEFPALDRDGRLATTERRHVIRTPTEVAVLKARDSEREVRLVKGLGYEESLPSDVKLAVQGEPEPGFHPTGSP